MGHTVHPLLCWALSVSLEGAACSVGRTSATQSLTDWMRQQRVTTPGLCGYETMPGTNRLTSGCREHRETQAVWEHPAENPQVFTASAWLPGWRIHLPGRSSQGCHIYGRCHARMSSAGQIGQHGQAVQGLLCSAKVFWFIENTVSVSYGVGRYGWFFLMGLFYNTWVTYCWWLSILPL